MSPGNATLTITRVLASSLSAYHDFVQEVLQEMEHLGWAPSILFGIHTALEESISNAIRHGNQEDPQKQVRVECQIGPRRFWASICDEGDGYAADAVPDCRSPENLEAPGGRGLALIRAYMTTVELSKNGSCLVMEKLLDEPAA